MRSCASSPGTGGDRLAQALSGDDGVYEIRIDRCGGASERGDGDRAGAPAPFELHNALLGDLQATSEGRGREAERLAQQPDPAGCGRGAREGLRGAAQGREFSVDLRGAEKRAGEGHGWSQDLAD